MKSYIHACMQKTNTLKKFKHILTLKLRYKAFVLYPIRFFIGREKPIYGKTATGEL